MIEKKYRSAISRHKSLFEGLGEFRGYFRGVETGYRFQNRDIAHRYFDTIDIYHDAICGWPLRCPLFKLNLNFWMETPGIFKICF
jgi:hypothetical protein